MMGRWESTSNYGKVGINLEWWEGGNQPQSSTGFCSHSSRCSPLIHQLHSSMVPRDWRMPRLSFYQVRVYYDPMLYCFGSCYDVPRRGALWTQKLKSHLVRTQSLNILPLEPGVGQYIAEQATLPARDFFLAHFYPSSPFTCIFPQTSPYFSCVGCG